MKSRICCFNGGVLRDRFRRFWPLSLSVLIVVLLMPGLTLLSRVQWYAGASGDTLTALAADSILSAGPVMMILMFGAAFLSAALVFRHLHALRELQFTLALPLKRRDVYVTSWAAGYLLIALPMALGLLIIGLALWAAGLGGACAALLKLLLAGLAGELLLYAMAVVACLLAGQTFGAVLIYLGMHFAAPVIFLGVSQIGETILPGIRLMASLSEQIEWLTPMQRLLMAVVCRYESVWAAPGAGRLPFDLSGSVRVAVGFAHPGVLGVCAGLALVILLV